VHLVGFIIRKIAFVAR